MAERRTEKIGLHRALSDRELLVTFAGFGLGILSLWASDPIWEFLGIDDTGRRTDLASSTAAVILFASFLITLSVQVDRIRTDTTATVSGLLTQLEQRVPDIRALQVMTSEHALEQLASQLTSASAYWNTRVAPTNIDPADTVTSLKHDKALARAIRSGCVYREVLSPQWEDRAHGLASLAERRPGQVHLHVVDAPLHPMLNFCVVKHRDGSMDAYLGWAMSRQRRFEQPCLRFRDQRVAEYLIEVFSGMAGGGRRPGPRGASKG